MGQVINATVAPDSYTAASTIDFHCEAFTLDVVNAAIYWQIKIPIGTSGNWETIETYMSPSSRRVSGDIGGVRVRAAIPLASLPAGAKQAIFTLRTVP